MKIIAFFLSFTFLFAAEETFLKDIDSLKTTNKTNQYVYLVRHGESVFNLPDKNGVYYTQGQSISSPLTENGKQQAIEIANLLQEKIPPNTQVTIASSTALRARNTAFTLFEALSKKSTIQIERAYANLLEVGKGPWEGRPKDEAFNKEFNEWKKLSAFDQWKTPQVSNAESIEAAGKRALLTLDELIQNHPDQTLFVVSHGGTITAVEHLLEKTTFSKDPESNFPKFKYRNCDILLLEIPKGEGLNKAKVKEHIRSGFSNTYR